MSRAFDFRDSAVRTELEATEVDLSRPVEFEGLFQRDNPKHVIMPSNFMR
jgi:hypothetical protein